jgi:hypothetical protein
MDSLIDQPEDVRVLRSQGVLIVTLGSEEEVAKLFNEVAKYLMPNPIVFNKVKKDIESHCRNTIKRWAAQNLDTYFSSPWSFITLVAASLTIALTAIQSYFTLFPLNNNGDCGKY